MNLQDLLKESLFECGVEEYSRRTIKSYKNNNNLFFNYLLQEVNIKDLEEIKPLHIKKYFKFMMQKGLKATYANSVLKSIRAFFRYYVKEEYLKENPCLKVSWQKEGKCEW